MKVKTAIAPELIVKRINRRLSEGQALKTARGAGVAEQVGDYFLIKNDSVVRPNVDLEKVAREYNALEPWETVAC